MHTYTGHPHSLDTTELSCLAPMNSTVGRQGDNYPILSAQHYPGTGIKVAKREGELGPRMPGKQEWERDTHNTLPWSEKVLSRSRRIVNWLGIAVGNTILHKQPRLPVN